jgi:predicted dehydrogenase
MNDVIRVAILGCGAITKTRHLPAVLAHRGVRLEALVDVDPKRAQTLAESHGLKCRIVSDYRLLLGAVDAFIVALPNSLHASVTLDALGSGLHVLSEKPLAIRPAEARSCAELAAQKKLVLAVGMNRRFQPASELFRMVLEEGRLGELRDYSGQYGGPYDWDTASGFYFSKEQAGGGVLLDYGVHILDLLIAWFGPVTRFDYQDDDWGSGLEANALLELQHSGPYGAVAGRLRLSRTYSLKNSLVVRGSEAAAEITSADPTSVVLHRTLAAQAIRESLALPGSEQAPSHSFYRQLDNFLASIRGLEKPRVDGWQALRVLELVDDCYARRRRIPEPWAESFEVASEVSA